MRHITRQEFETIATTYAKEIERELLEIYPHVTRAQLFNYIDLAYAGNVRTLRDVAKHLCDNCAFSVIRVYHNDIAKLFECNANDKVAYYSGWDIVQNKVVELALRKLKAN